MSSELYSKQLPKLLVIDDDPTWLDQVPIIFEDECEVEGFPTIDQGLAAVADRFYDVILLDLNFKGDPRSGLDAFKRIQALDRGADVIMITAETNGAKIIELCNAGVAKFIAKPCQPEQVRNAVRAVLDQRELRKRVFSRQDSSKAAKKLLIGSSPAIQKLRDQIMSVVKGKRADILLQGPNGCGKEVVARVIVELSDRSGRMVNLNCGAMNENLVEAELFGHAKGAFTGAETAKIGAFEAAGGGWILLDEIGDMPLTQQVKLLRVLQERKVKPMGTQEERDVNFHLISATNVDLDTAVADKRFREDLYYRIAQAKIVIPSLSDRAADIPEMFEAYLAGKPENRQVTITSEALALLQAYEWPGNVRQFHSVIDSICSKLAGKVIREKDICQVLPAVTVLLNSRITKSLVGQYGARMISNERRRFEKAIIQARGDRETAAKLLGVSRATFFRKAKDLGLVRERRSSPVNF